MLAAVLAEVSDIRGVVGVRRAAADAVLRVRRMLQRGTRVCGSSTPKRSTRSRPSPSDATSGSSAPTTAAPRAELRDGRPPALGDVLELAIAIELVAEEVREADDARPCASHDLWERELVDLEQAELRVARGEQGRRDPRGQVRAGSIPREPAHGGEDRARHRHGRRLAVRRGHERDARGEAARERVERGRDRASRRASPAAWCRRPGRSHARAARRIGPPRSRVASRAGIARAYRQEVALPNLQVVENALP